MLPARLYEGSFYTAESPLLWPKVGDCTVIADPINCSSIACLDVNFGNKPRGLDVGRAQPRRARASAHHQDNPRPRLQAVFVLNVGTWEPVFELEAGRQDLVRPGAR